jgi:DNA repair protein RadD
MRLRGAGGVAHATAPGDLAVVSSERERVVNTYAVTGIEYRRHEKPGKTPSLRVIYRCGLRQFSEWVCIEHAGFAGAKAQQWWIARAGVAGSVPANLNQALEVAYSLPTPREITVDETAKYPSVTGYVFAPQTPVAARADVPADPMPEFLRRALA